MNPIDNQRATRVEEVSNRELRLLEAVSLVPQQSQRRLAHSVGIALGVANVLLRNLARKGYIRASKVGWRRWAYVLTPAGVSRKVQLTLAYVERTLDHYSRVRDMVKLELQAAVVGAESRVAIYGCTELAELVYLALRDMEIGKIEFFDRCDSRQHFLGLPVSKLEDLVSDRFAKVMVADSSKIEERKQELFAAGIPSDKVVTFLGNHMISKPNSSIAE